MMDKMKVADRIYKNLRFSADTVTEHDCYYICANKQNIRQLATRDHQIIWGRRGTGKTTLLKAFVYDKMFCEPSPVEAALYLMMASTIPTREELQQVSGGAVTTDKGKNDIAIYIFFKLVTELCEKLQELFNERADALDAKESETFVSAYCELTEYIDRYKTLLSGGVLTIEQQRGQEIKKELSGGVEFKPKETPFLASLFSFLSRGTRNTSASEKMTVSGEISFVFDSLKVKKYIQEMVKSLKIETLYLCIDEFSELDKLDIDGIQYRVAQLLKQVFFKDPLFSVKLAAIWDHTQLHSKGDKYIEGLEVQQDIFQGPDLDVIFMTNNDKVVNYFLTMLVNCYYVDSGFSDNDRDRKYKEKEAVAALIRDEIFGINKLNCLICGSQGISRSFAVLARGYLQEYLDKGKVSDACVYEMIKKNYSHDIVAKLPAYRVFKTIRSDLSAHPRRYFLLPQKDYKRCRKIVKFYVDRGLYVQIPSLFAPSMISDDYRLFIVHYGAFLQDLENTDSYKNGRKTLEQDSGAQAQGLLPIFDDLRSGDKLAEYVISLPEGCENECYCRSCEEFFDDDSGSAELTCPYCGKPVQRDSVFRDDAAVHGRGR